MPENVLSVLQSSENTMSNPRGAETLVSVSMSIGSRILLPDMIRETILTGKSTARDNKFGVGLALDWEIENSLLSLLLLRMKEDSSLEGDRFPG
mmetsp:Transcript_26635/g.59274  ORF Transcript_26635/g.59274 Transcript_26635/m.59274 type:complete len:94 (+) Transcript_26635:794-1075(+)